MTDNAHSSGKAANNLSHEFVRSTTQRRESGRNSAVPKLDFTHSTTQPSPHLAATVPHQPAQKKHEIRGFAPLSEMIINRPGRWIISKQHLPLTAGVNKICNDCEYPVEVCPLLSVKARQEPADAISLSAFKLYFHGLNNLCY